MNPINNFYNKNLLQFSRELRSERSTRAERHLWKSLLSKKQTGHRFLRQRPISNFIVDFFCPKLKLIIEIDGSSHIHKGDYDMIRQNKLKGLGFTIIQYKEGEVLNCLDEVTNDIRNVIYSLETEC